MHTKIVFLDRQSIRPDIHIRPPDCDHTWVNHGTTLPQQVIARCQDADIIITNKVALDAATIKALPQLKMVAVAATGTDPIDLRACQQRHIRVANIRNYALTTVPEHVLCLILNLRRQTPQYQRELGKGRWQKSTNFCFFDAPIHDAKDARLGIIGYGALGRATAQLAHNIGMQVQYYTPNPKSCTFAKAVDLNTLLKTSDIVSCHCPLNDATRHLINATALQKMKSSAILINTARGDIVDEQALAAALSCHEIAAAGIDVLPQEPPPADSPLMQLADRPNLILTPHIAWASQAAMQALADQLIDNIEAFLRGQPQNIVA